MNLSALYFRQSSAQNIEKSKQLPVSILKPLKGADANLSVNLETFFTMDYPKYELLFCVQDDDDPAIEVVRKLMEKYPEIDAQLVIGGATVGINPKVNNMIPGYERAKYDLIMISDDKMFIQSDALQDMSERIFSNETIGIVMQVPYYKTRAGFSAFFENVMMVIMYKFYVVSKVSKQLVTPGMSCLIRKVVLQSAGGLEHFGIYLAEDVKMIRFAKRNGWRVIYSRKFGLQNQSNSGVLSLYKRIGRWGRVAKFPRMKAFHVAVALL